MASEGSGGPRPVQDAGADLRARRLAERRARTRMMQWGGLGLAGLLVLLILGFAIALFVGPGPKAKSGEATVFVVERGDGASTIAARLAAQGLVRQSIAFRVMAAIGGQSGALKPGEYEIPSGASPGRIAAILASGRGITRSITIPEGWTVRMAFARIAANEVLSGDLPPLPPEGSLLPETYVVQRGDTRAALVQRMMEAQTKALDELWLKRAPDLPFTTKLEAVTLASIVEKETSVPAERPRVAAVFVNRLREGIKLQSDPTIIYGITKGEPLRRRIRKSEIEMAHPWNTYVIQGLPPSPIANPGTASIAAVLNPPRTRELFFVADGTGGHVFAETYAEHNRNVLRWRELRRQREERDEDLADASAPEDRPQGDPKASSPAPAQ